MSPTSIARPHSAWSRRLLVAVLVILLAGLGFYEEELFAALGHLWHPSSTAASVALPGLTTHGMPVAISYRLLYAVLNVGLLHLLLHGRYTKVALVSYAAGYIANVGLLLLGQRAGLPAATITAHRLLDMLSSPLPVMFAYPLAILSQSWPTRSIS